MQRLMSRHGHFSKALIVLLLFTFVVLPVLPNHTLDSWQLFNPRKFGLLLAAIAYLQLGGFVAVRLFDQRIGVAFTGFFGGFISSTAVFLTLPQLLRTYSQLFYATAAAAVLSNLAMLIVITTIVYISSTTLFYAVIWPLVAMMSTCCVMALILFYCQPLAQYALPEKTDPLDYLAVIRMALFMAILIVTIAVVKRIVGTDGVVLVSFLGGLVEIHSITLATVLLYLENQIQLVDARIVLFAAIFATFVSKFVMLWALTPPRFAGLVSVLLAGILMSGFLTYAV